jgi:hypothetical protein
VRADEAAKTCGGGGARAKSAESRRATRGVAGPTKWTRLRNSPAWATSLFLSLSLAHVRGGADECRVWEAARVLTVSAVSVRKTRPCSSFASTTFCCPRHFLAITMCCANTAKNIHHRAHTHIHRLCICSSSDGDNGGSESRAHAANFSFLICKSDPPGCNYNSLCATPEIAARNSPRRLKHAFQCCIKFSPETQRVYSVIIIICWNKTLGFSNKLGILQG